MEFVRDATSLRHVLSISRSENEASSVIGHTLAALAMAHSCTGFTHYDLHSNNVMIRSCNPNIVFACRLNRGETLAFASHGMFPCFIDFGFSHVDALDGEYADYTLNHSELGILPNRRDPDFDIGHLCSDAAVAFGYSVRDAVVTYDRRDTGLFHLLESLVRSTRYSRTRDNDANKLSVLERLAFAVFRSLRQARVQSRLFSINFITETLDTLKSMHKTPLTAPISGPGDGTDRERASQYVLLVCREWASVERVVPSNTRAMYIFHESVRCIKEEGYMFSDNPALFLEKFMAVFSAAFRRVDHTPPLDFDAEKFVCALCSLSCCIAGALARVLSEVTDEDKKAKKTPEDFARRFHVKANLGTVSLTEASLVVFLDSVQNRAVAWNPSPTFREKVHGLSWSDASPLFHDVQINIY
jgi:hypothetical protein